MRAVLLIMAVALATPAAAKAQAGELEAVAARLRTHAETAGLREASNPIVGADAVVHSVGGSLGRVQAFFLDLATSEPNLEVTSVELGRAPDAMRARSASLLMNYTVRYVAAPDERLARAQWALPAVFNALLTGAVTGRDVTIHAGRIVDGKLTLDARSKNKDAAQALVTQLNPGPQNFVRSADVAQEQKRERIMDPNNDMPVRDVSVYAFRITARIDPSGVHMSVLKRLAHAY
jgi:hypothetical protein